MKMTRFKSLFLVIGAACSSLLLSACHITGDPPPALYYPYQTAYGTVCSSMEPKTGCTFNRDGTRITVSQDPDYNKSGAGSNDLWYVKFDSFGTAYVYSPTNSGLVPDQIMDISDFGGYQGGTNFGAGPYSFDVSTYDYFWVGKGSWGQAVVYIADSASLYYGEAINKLLGKNPGPNFSALVAQKHEQLVHSAANDLTEKIAGLSYESAAVIAESVGTAMWDAGARGTLTKNEAEGAVKAALGSDVGVVFDQAKKMAQAKRDGQTWDNAILSKELNRTAQHLGLSTDGAVNALEILYAEPIDRYDVNTQALQDAILK